MGFKNLRIVSIAPEPDDWAKAQNFVSIKILELKLVAIDIGIRGCPIDEYRKKQASVDNTINERQQALIQKILDEELKRAEAEEKN